MNIIGTIYVVDEPNINVLKNKLMTYAPPMAGLPNMKGTALCVDMDETSNDIELMFPMHTQKGTLLCPPPAALYKEIDGDSEGFINAYNEYLEFDESVSEFIASMLLYLHMGGDIILYTPAYIEDNTIWMNTLIMFFYTRYGINMGTSATNDAFYDSKYDAVIAEFLFRHSMIDVFDYINSSPNVTIDDTVFMKTCYELEPFCMPGEHPVEIFNFMKNSLLIHRTPIIKPAIIFER